jgi:uncharacterized CHY-type Zn-finger protein
LQGQWQEVIDMRLINADALIAEMHNVILEDGEDRRIFYEVIERQPTIEEHKTGKWQVTDAYPHNVYCSECHKKFAQTHWAVWEDGSLPRNYCPNCGAKMEAET